MVLEISSLKCEELALFFGHIYNFYISFHLLVFYLIGIVTIPLVQRGSHSSCQCQPAERTGEENQGAREGEQDVKGNRGVTEGIDHSQ